MSTSPRIITFGEIMLRLSTPGFSRFAQAQSFNATYGGGDANVAISLAVMGMDAAHVTRFPDNDLGRAATELLKKNGVDTTHVLYGGQRLGLYYLETGAIMRPSKVVYDRADSSFATIATGMFDWDSIFEEATWFHFTGITPAISAGAVDVCFEALEVAKAKGITISIDVNYRKNLWQFDRTPQEVMSKLVEYADIIFASKGDMKELFGLEAPTFEDDKFPNIATLALNKYPNLKKIVNSKRDSNSASDNNISGTAIDRETIYNTRKYKLMPIVDRIGGGDAFCAGYIYGEIVYKDTQTALDFAVAASALKHTIEGDANLATVQEIETVMRGDTSGKLSR